MNSTLPTIGIADDHAQVRGIMRWLLTNSNFPVIMEAANGKELLEQLETATEIPEVCLLDVNMPEMDGFETARKIKEKWPSIRILAISSDTHLDTANKMLQMGADKFISKSCTVTELKEAIMSIAKNRKIVSQEV